MGCGQLAYLKPSSTNPHSPEVALTCAIGLEGALNTCPLGQLEQLLPLGSDW